MPLQGVKQFTRRSPELDGRVKAGRRQNPTIGSGGYSFDGGWVGLPGLGYATVWVPQANSAAGGRDRNPMAPRIWHQHHIFHPGSIDIQGRDLGQGSAPESNGFVVAAAHDHIPGGVQRQGRHRIAMPLQG